MKLKIFIALFLWTGVAFGQVVTQRTNQSNNTTEWYVRNSPTNIIGNSKVVMVWKDSTMMMIAFDSLAFPELALRTDAPPFRSLGIDASGNVLASIPVGGGMDSLFFIQGLTKVGDSVKLGGYVTDSAVLRLSKTGRIEATSEGFEYFDPWNVNRPVFFGWRDTVTTNGYYDTPPNTFGVERQLFYPNYLSTSSYRSAQWVRMSYYMKDSTRIRTFGGDFMGAIKGEIVIEQQPGQTNQIHWKNFSTIYSEAAPAINAIVRLYGANGTSSVKTTGGLAGFTPTFITNNNDTADLWIQFNGSSSFHNGNLKRYVGLYLEPPAPNAPTRTWHYWGVLNPWSFVPNYFAGKTFFGKDSSQLQKWQLASTGKVFVRDTLYKGKEIIVTDTTGLKIQARRFSDSAIVDVPVHVLMSGSGGSGGGSGLDSAILTSDVVGTATTGAQNITGLSFTAEANERYFIVGELLVNSIDATTGGSIGINGPASPTIVSFRVLIPQNTTSISQGAGSDYSTRGATSNTISSWTAVQFSGWVQVPTSGTVTLRFAQETATTGAWTIKAGSFMTYKKMYTFVP